MLPVKERPVALLNRGASCQWQQKMLSLDTGGPDGHQQTETHNALCNPSQQKANGCRPTLSKDQAVQAGIAGTFSAGPIRHGLALKLATPGPSPTASEALQLIAELYAVENDIRGRSAAERRLLRQQKSRPLVDAIEPWLRAKLTLISQKNKLAVAIRYALS